MHTHEDPRNRTCTQAYAHSAHAHAHTHTTHTATQRVFGSAGNAGGALAVLFDELADVVATEADGNGFVTVRMK